MSAPESFNTTAKGLENLCKIPIWCSVVEVYCLDG